MPRRDSMESIASLEDSQHRRSRRKKKTVTEKRGSRSRSPNKASKTKPRSHSPSKRAHSRGTSPKKSPASSRRRGRRSSGVSGTRRRGRSPSSSSDSLESIASNRSGNESLESLLSSGSSIGSTSNQGTISSIDSDAADVSAGSRRRGGGEKSRRRRRRSHASQTAGADQLYTRQETRFIKASLKHKLLSREGEPLADVERQMHLADKNGKGTLSEQRFKDAVLLASRNDKHASLHKDEVRWLCAQLSTRNGLIKYTKIRSVLEASARRTPHRRGDGLRPTHQPHHAKNGSAKFGLVPIPHVGSDGEEGYGGPFDEGGEGGSIGSGDLGYEGPVANWAVRHGSVGQWLHEVASPMERKLFNDFIGLMSEFEYKSGLDHYRGASGQPVRAPGSTVLHLGPTLKAAIKFYV